MLTPASKYRKGCTTCVFISRKKCLDFFISEAAGGSEWTFCSSHKHTLSCTWKCLSACLMFLVWQEGSSGWWYPWATISWSKSWGITHKICYWAVLGMDNQEKKPPISPGAAVLVLLRHTIPRINHCQKCQEIMRNWWSLQKALTALQVMKPCQGHAKKSILQRILPSLCSAACRLELMLCSGM